MKKIADLFLIIFITLAVLVFARNVIVKVAVENGVRAVTGMPLVIKKLDLGLTQPYFDIGGLVVKNPAGFHDTILVEIPRIFVAYDLSSILKGKIHLTNLEFDLKQFSVVKNEKGLLNLDSLKALQAQQPSQPGQRSASTKAGKAPAIQIDNFRLRVGTASYIDYSSGSPVTKDFNVGLDEKYTNITDPNKLVALIVWKVMMKTPLAMLSGFSLGGLEGSVSGILGSATDMAGQSFAMGMEKMTTSTQSVTKVATEGMGALNNAAQSSGQLAGQAEGTLKDAAGTVTGGVKEAASALKNKLKLPF